MLGAGEVIGIWDMERICEGRQGDLEIADRELGVGDPLPWGSRRMCSWSQSLVEG